MKRADVIHAITNLKGTSGHKWVVDTYNNISPLPRGYKLKTSDAWCAATVSAVLHSVGYDDLAECSCPRMIEKAQKLGLWVENDAYTPQTGDIIMYDWQDSGKGDNTGVADHVGIVVKVDKSKITVREGNKGGSVGNRTIDIDGKFIRGYIVPPYEDEDAILETQPANTQPVEEKPVEKAQTSSDKYSVGKVYTISVRSALNVRKGAGKNYELVGHSNLTPDGRKHAVGSALRNGTRVTCLEVKENSKTDVWIRIPSGWVCAIDGTKKMIV